MDHNEHIIDMEIMEATAPSKLKLKEILKQVFTSPAKGTYEMFADRHANTSLTGILLIIFFGVLGPVMLYLMKDFYVLSGEPGYLIKLGMFCMLFTCLISIFVFIVNAVAKRIDFGKALLTGGIVGFIAVCHLVVVYLISLVHSGMLAPVSQMGHGNHGDPLWIWVFIIIFTATLAFNVVTQSLRAGNEKDGASFFLSPIIIIFSFYLTMKIAHLMLGM